MTQKCRARLCTPGVAHHLFVTLPSSVFQPSFCVRSLLLRVMRIFSVKTRRKTALISLIAFKATPTMRNYLASSMILPQRKILGCVPHLQHDYFVMFNQSHYWFLRHSSKISKALWFSHNRPIARRSWYSAVFFFFFHSIGSTAKSCVWAIAITYIEHFFVAIIWKRGSNAQEPLTTFQQDVRKTEYNFLALIFPRWPGR